MSFVTDQAQCRCQNCSATLTFDRSQTGQTVNCPQCQLDTVLYLPHRSQIQKPVPKKSNFLLWVFASAAFLLIALLLTFVQMQGTFSDAGHPLGEAIILGTLLTLLSGVGLVIYFIPTIVARKNEQRNFTAIFMLNIFLGWSLVGWVVALVWACMVEKK